MTPAVVVVECGDDLGSAIFEALLRETKWRRVRTLLLHYPRLAPQGAALQQRIHGFERLVFPFDTAELQNWLAG